MANQVLKTKVLNEDGVLFDGECKAVFVPVKKEKIAILPFHTPLISLINAGEILVHTQGKIRNIATVKEGILYVGQNEVIVLING